jgi:hypothetical protein
LVVGPYQPLADGNGYLLLFNTAFRCPTKLAFCSRFRRQRKMPVDLAECGRMAIFFGLWAPYFPAQARPKDGSHKAQKGRRWKNRQPSHSAPDLT